MVQFGTSLGAGPNQGGGAGGIRALGPQPQAATGFVPRVIGETDVEPYTRILQGSATDSEVFWNRIEIPVPTVAWPYRNDNLTGTGDMDYLVISYSKNRPVSTDSGFPSNSLIFPSAKRGACYMWHPGIWYIRCQSGSKTFGDFSIGFNFLPIVDANVLSYFDFDRYPQLSTNVTSTIAHDPATKLISTQEMLDGVVGVMVQCRQSNMRFTWGLNDNTNFWRLNSNDIIVFSGSTLPLSDFYGRARPSQNDVVTISTYKQVGVF